MKKKPLWSSPSPRSQWKDNHGSLLVGLAAGVLAFGFGLIAYQQFRFVPVRFPDSDAIDPPIRVESDPAGSVNPGSVNPGTVTSPEARAPTAEPSTAESPAPPRQRDGVPLSRQNATVGDSSTTRLWER